MLKKYLSSFSRWCLQKEPGTAGRQQEKMGALYDKLLPSKSDFCKKFLDAWYVIISCSLHFLFSDVKSCRSVFYLSS